MKLRVLPLLVAIVLAAGLAGQVAQDMAGFFPEISGWKLKDKPLVFNPDNLYEYIDGAAESYLSYEFQLLAVRSYENAASRTMTIEIYRHSSKRSAFGIYSSEKPLAGEYLNLGGEGYREDGVLNFFCGAYYVKISAYDLEAREAARLPGIAKGIANRIGAEPGLPAELAFFPAAGKIAHSEQFIQKNFLGHAFLNSAFRADYERGGKRFQVFLLLGNDRADAQRVLKKWLELAEKKAVADPAEGACQLLDPYNGKVTLEWRGSHIWGAVKCPNGESAPLLAELKTNAERMKW